MLRCKLGLLCEVELETLTAASDIGDSSEVRLHLVVIVALQDLLEMIHSLLVSRLVEICRQHVVEDVLDGARIGLRHWVQRLLNLDRL